ncbi:MAG: SHOCT domain-containing protein [Chloroflexi bacterium]|nr:SHOCT domain-containing protein [Chloroflexota bacterium]
MERSTSRVLWIGLGLVVILLLVTSSLGGGMLFGRGLVAPFGPFGFRPFVGPWLFGVWGIGLLVRLLFFGLIFYLVMRLFRGGRGYRRGYFDGFSQQHPLDQTPEEILRRRYAAGEISREQYEEMRRTLEPAV